MDTGVELPPRGRLLWILFWEFTKISTLVIGGGYVIFAAIEEEFVKRRKYITHDDFLEMIGIAQTVPGIIACNGAIYIGFRLAGWRGAALALLGSILPPVAIIIAVAGALERIPTGNAYVTGAMAGINSCIVGLLLATGVRMGKKLLTGWFECALAFGCLTGMVAFSATPGYLILASIPLGIAYTALRDRCAAPKEA